MSHSCFYRQNRFMYILCTQMKFIRIKITLFILFVSLTYSSEKEEIYQLLNKPR